MDVELGYQEVDSGVVVQTDLPLGRSEFRWQNAGGIPGAQIIVTQVGNYAGYHKVTEDALSTELIDSDTWPSAQYSDNFSYAVVDNKLLICNGYKWITILDYDGTSIIKDFKRLLVRDLFGVDAFYLSSNLTESRNINYRPPSSSVSKAHLYNLRNQTYSLRRPTDIDDTFSYDPLERFIAASGFTTAPSNADNTNRFHYPEPNYTNFPTVDRYFAEDHFRTAASNYRSPMGHFIIDVLDRGVDRQTQLDLLYSRSLNGAPNTFPQPPGSLPQDYTDAGPKVVASYAGRAWYAGFNSTVIDGDTKSPKLGSYVLFSKIAQSTEDLIKCFQSADPTSPEDPDIVADDGGFVKLSGAYDIVGMLPIGPYLFVFARNGVWRISGIDGNLFNATSYSASKLSEFGCISGTSIVSYGAEAFFWGEEAIYRLAQEEVSGDYTVQNITEQTIQSRYDALTSTEKESSVGYYDYRDSSFRWLFGADPGNSTSTQEWALNRKFSSFTINSIESQGVVEGVLSATGGFPLVGEREVSVKVSSVPVTVSSAEVFITTDDVSVSASSAFYTIITSTSGTLKYTFGGYQEDAYLDWERIDGTGFLPEAYLTTGPISSAEGRLRKGVPYLTVHMPNNGDQASCLFSARWSWSQAVTTGKWSSLRNAYRRNFHTEDRDIVTTRNKSRGSGKAVSFKFENDGVNPIHLYGWEFNLTANQDE
jgi:hypothetical protein